MLPYNYMNFWFKIYLGICKDQIREILPNLQINTDISEG